MSAMAATLLTANASAMIEFDPDARVIQYKTKVSCLNSWGADGQLTIHSSEYCDQSNNNKINNRPLKDNGCADEQVAIKETVRQNKKFKIKIKECAVENDSAIEPSQL